MSALRDRVVSRFKTAAELDVQKLRQMLDDAKKMGLPVVILELERLLAKAEAQGSAPAAKKHPLEVGSILVCSWGYDQTNIDYYQVTKLLGVAMVEIREIGKKFIRTERTSDLVTAEPGHFIGQPQRRRVRPDGSIKLTSYSNAYPWDGKPDYETNSLFGH